ncbi:DNA pilot protein [Microviridae sp.]|nr:DNA pilot protein [Microviridae sp.]
MDPVTAVALATAAQSAGTYFTNKSNRREARRTNRFNAAQAAVNRDFQDKMSSSAYSRAHEDLTKAGFNPLLSMSSPASSPSGAQSTGGYATAENPLGSLTESVSSAQALKKNQAEIKSITQNTNVSKVQEKLLEHQIDNMDANTAYKLSEVEKNKSEQHRIDVNKIPYEFLTSIRKSFKYDPSSITDKISDISKNALKKFNGFNKFGGYEFNKMTKEKAKRLSEKVKKGR